MKKTPARILAVAIAILLALSLSACGDSFESAMTRAVSEMQDVESLHMDMVMGIDMSLSADGQTLEMPISMDMSMDTINEPLTARATMNMNVMQQPVSVEYYVERSGESYMMYANMDGGGWEAAAVDETELGQFSAVEGVEFYLQCAYAFEKVGEEEVRGATASRLFDLSNQKLLLFFFASRESCKCHKQAGQKHHYRSLGRLLSGLRQRCQRNISIIDGGSGSLRRERSQRHVAFID